MLRRSIVFTRPHPRREGEALSRSNFSNVFGLIRPSSSVAVFARLRLRLRNALDEIVRRRMRLDAGRAGAFAGPGKMAIVTVEFLRQHMDVCQEANEEIRQRGFMGVLRIIHAHRMAFRAANGAGNSSVGRSPVLQQGIGLLEFVSRDYEVSAVNTGAVVKFRGDSRIFQSPLILFAVKATAKECNGDFIHESMSAEEGEKSMG